MTGSRRFLAAVAASLLGIFVAAVATVVVAVLAGLTIDVSRWRDAAAERATAALGRSVVLRAPLDLTLGREAVLRIGGIEVGNPPGFKTAEFAALGDLRVRFDLLDAVRGSLNVLSIDANAGRLRLERSVDGHPNWNLASTRSAPEAPRGAASVGAIVLRNFKVGYDDARAGRHFSVGVDELTADGRLDEPLRVSLRGHAGPESAYRLTVAGGPPRRLIEENAPWPFELAFQHADTRFDARGSVAPGVQAVDVAQLRGWVKGSELAGQLALELAGARPRLRGTLDVATLDLDGLLAAGDAPAAGGFADLPLRGPLPLDAKLDLSVRELSATAVTVRDLKIELRAGAERMRAPLRATLFGVPVSGSLDFDLAAGGPALGVRLDARNVALADVGDAVASPEGVSGTVGRLGLHLAGRGETLAALARSLDLAISAADARLRYERGGGAQPISATLDAFDLSLRAGERLRGSARGTLQGKRAKLAVRGGTLPDALRERVLPVEVELSAAGSQLSIAGMLALPGSAGGTDIDFRLDVPRIGDLAPWLPVERSARLPLAARGRVRAAADTWQIDGMKLRLGRSEATIDARRGDDGAGHVTTAAVRGPLIDVPELMSLGAQKSKRADDAPMFAPGFMLPEADIELQLGRVALRRIDLADVKFHGLFRGGRLLPSRFAASVAETPLEGSVALDPTGRVPEASFEVATGAIDVGGWLRALGLAEAIDGRADAVQIALHARGNTPRELAEHSSLDGRVTGGTFTMRGPANREAVEIGVRQATLAVPVGGRLQAHVDGVLGEIPLAMEISGGTLADLAGDARRVPLSVDARVAETRFELAGDVLLPLGRGGELTVKAGGARLDTLNALARVELPPWGPWSIRGPVSFTRTGYEMRGLEASIGGNRLTGNGRFDVGGERPRLELDVAAETIQLDDFPLPQRLADDRPPAPGEGGVRAIARSAALRTERLLNAGFLRRVDASLEVAVKDVRWGSDRLADGLLRIQVIDGQLYLGPAEVAMPGGRLTLAIAYDPTGSEFDLKAGAYVERFEYGVILRHLQRGEDARGLLSANVEIASRTPSLDRVMAHANGRIDFAIWPEGMGGRIFRLWSANLLFAVLPIIDPRAESQLNCIVGRFDLNDGVLSDDKVLIDTTRVRVRGAGNANLRTEKLDFMFRPRGKGFDLFRLQKPVRVTGTLYDYRFGIDRRELISATLRMLASPILVPWEWLTLGPLPRDGADVCTDPLR